MKIKAIGMLTAGMLPLLVFCPNALLAGSRQVLKQGLAFNPGLNAGEKKDLYIYLNKVEVKTALSQYASSRISIVKNGDKISVGNSRIKMVINKSGRVESFLIKPTPVSSFQPIGGGDICHPRIIYKDAKEEGTGLELQIQNVECADIIEGPVVAILSYQGTYSDIGLVWKRYYYFFEHVDYCIIKDLFIPDEEEPKPYRWNNHYSRTEVQLGDDFVQNFIAYEDGWKKMHSGIKVVKEAEKASFLVPPKYGAFGSWISQYNPVENLFFGIAVKYQVKNIMFQVYSMLQPSGKYLIDIIKSVSLQPGVITSDIKWVTAGRGDFKNVALAATRINEEIPFRVGNIEEKKGEGWWNGNWAYRIKITLNNYTEIDRTNETLILPLDSLGIDIAGISVESFRVVVPDPHRKSAKTDGSNGTEIPSQIVPQP